MNPRNLTTLLANSGTPLRLLLTALGVLVVAVTIVAPQASAYSEGSQHSPGRVSVSTIVGGHQFYRDFRDRTPFLQHHTMEMCRSSSTAGAQTVSASYLVRHWNGYSWGAQIEHTGPKVTLPKWFSCGKVTGFVWTQNFMNLGAFTVDVIYRWHDEYGRYLGARVLSFVHQADYGCAATQFTCQTGPGWIFLG